MAKKKDSVDVELLGGGYHAFVDKVNEADEVTLKGEPVLEARPLEILQKDGKNSSIRWEDEEGEEWYTSAYAKLVSILEKEFKDPKGEYPDQKGKSILELSPLMRIESAPEYKKLEDGKKVLDFVSVKILEW